MYRREIWESGFTSNATRERRGIASLSNCKRFPIKSEEKFDNPVTFPPGRLKLSTSLVRIGSGMNMKTIGIVLVASLNASAA